MRFGASSGRFAVALNVFHWPMRAQRGPIARGVPPAGPSLFVTGLERAVRKRNDSSLSPRKEDKWFCTYGHEWNTFDTRRVSCPPPSVNRDRVPLLQPMVASFGLVRALDACLVLGALR